MRATFKHMASVVQGGTVQEKIARLRSTLGRSSRKWSIPRERILNAFLAQDHVTVHELHGLLNINGRRVSFSTIYRTMSMLCNAGIARLRHFGEKAQYDNVASKGDHDHLICTDCGKIVEFKDSAIEHLRHQIAAAHGFCLTAQNLELYGLCSRCTSSRRGCCAIAQLVDRRFESVLAFPPFNGTDVVPANQDRT